MVTSMLSIKVSWETRLGNSGSNHHHYCLFISSHGHRAVNNFSEFDIGPITDWSLSLISKYLAVFACLFLLLVYHFYYR